MEAERQIEEAETARLAKRPRHDDLDLQILLEKGDAEDPATLATAFEDILKVENPRRYADPGITFFATMPMRMRMRARSRS